MTADAELEEDAAVLGLDLARLAPDADDGAIALWPGNVGALRLFDAMGTQIRLATGLGGTAVTGFDYQALPTVAGALGLKLDRRLFEDFRVCEAAALAVWNRRGS